MRKSPQFSPEVIERAVRMVFEAKDHYPSQWAAIESIAGKIGCTAETLREWVRQGERDSGVRPGSTPADQQIDFHLRGEYITLDNLLKATGASSSGATAKQSVAAGLVNVDGQQELRKTAKIRAGQSVQFCAGSQSLHIRVLTTVGDYAQGTQSIGVARAEVNQ